jgi:hypothetical protein
MALSEMSAPIRLTVALLLLWLAYAVGASALDESVQTVAGNDAADLRAVLIAAFGGAHVMLLIACAWPIATGSSVE